MIHVENLTKEFKFKKNTPGLKGAIKGLFSNATETKVAVNNISFDISPGEIVGYIGSNGAGKSTTIKMMTGILVPTRGKCLVNGIVPYEKRMENAQNIGVVFGQRTQLWWDLPLSETFTILRDIYRVPSKDFEKRMEFLESVLGFNEFINSTVRTLSLGQRMRADLAAAMIHNPKILFLDEPSIGLDVVVKENIRKAIKLMNKEFNTTVLLTTHDMAEIEELCNRIIIIDSGEKIYDGDKKQFKDKYGYMKTIEMSITNEEKAKTIDFNSIFNLNSKDINWSIKDQKIILNYHKDKLSSMQIISCTMDKVDINDINIRELPIEDIVKGIYQGLS
jgi:ABC-2 type transport system ATP-binding protein